MSKSIEEKFKKLTDIEHCLTRPGMYIGSTQAHTAECWIYDQETNKMVKREVTWNPGFQKLFDEVISNSVDHSKRPEGKHLDTIKVDLNRMTGDISVYDNGGIPVVIHKDHGMYVPSMLFSELKAGSNFDDSEQRDWVGTNGVGASLVNIFSTNFIVETCDGKKSLRQVFRNNNHDRDEPVVKNSTNAHTKITFSPDYARLGCELDDGNYLKIVKRIVDVAACNPTIKIYLNGERIQIKSFKDYVSLFSDEYEYEELESGWKFGICHSSDGFQHVSFVNGSETIVGGSHVDYIRYRLCEALREFFKKKHKVDLRPADIYSHITIFLDAKVMNPKYDSQTKEKLINELPKETRDACEISEKLIKKITQSHIIQSVLDWVEAKAKAQEMADLRKLNKTLDRSSPKSVEKFHDATSKNRAETSLFLVEGDCLREDTKVEILGPDGITSTEIKDINIGDLVITHKHNFKRITQKQHRLNTTVEIKTHLGSIHPSPNHRLYVYNTKTLEFEFIRCADINKDVHKLVRSKAIDYDCVANIVKIKKIDEEKYKLMIFVDNNGTIETIKSSLSHKFGVINIKEERFDFLRADELDIETHVFLMKQQ